MNDKHLLIYLGVIVVVGMLVAGSSEYHQDQLKTANYQACLSKTQNAVECGKILK